MNSCILRKISAKRFLHTIIVVVILYALLPIRFAVFYKHIPNEEIRYYLAPSSMLKLQSCPVLPKLSMLRHELVKDYYVDESKYAEYLNVEMGGKWQPENCEYVHDVAVVIPFRDRIKQLNIFLHHIHPFLQKQLISYRIFVIEQTFLKPFNRGLLLNVGFIEALKIHDFHCFIFHDVDLLPLVESNMYACTHMPRHLCSAINTWRYNLKYEKAFGGAIAILKEHFSQINGFSNIYFGWGGEDDDIMERISKNQLEYCRFSPEISKYHMLHHKPEKKNPDRIEYLLNASKRFKTDGINSVNYTILIYEEKPLYTYVLVNPM